MIRFRRNPEEQPQGGGYLGNPKPGKEKDKYTKWAIALLVLAVAVIIYINI